MSSIDKIMRSFDELYYFLKKNQQIIDWINIEKDLLRLIVQIKKSIVPPKSIKDIFSNKKFFPSQAHIKAFMKDNFNIDLKGKTNRDIFSEITYYSLEITDLISQIENKLKTMKLEKIIKPSKESNGKQIKIIEETWDDWTKLNRTDLIQHLKKLTLPQIKSIAGNLLSSDDQKLSKSVLIEKIANKINKLKTLL